MFKKSVINIEISNDIEQALEFAKTNGFDEVEIHGVWGKNIETLDDGELMRLNQLIKGQGLKVSCIASTLFLRCYLEDRSDIAPEVRGFDAVAGDYAYHLKTLQQAIRSAKILGAPLIRVFGFHNEGSPTDELFERAAKRFLKPAEMAKEAGVVLAMETCPHTSFGWGGHAARLVATVDSPAFRLLWDPAGSVRAGEPDCIQSMPAMLPLLAHVHAKDILLKPDGSRQYLALGQGIIPWNIIFRELIQRKYEGAVSVEPHFLGQDGTKAGGVLESWNAMQEILSTLDYLPA